MTPEVLPAAVARRRLVAASGDPDRLNWRVHGLCTGRSDLFVVTGVRLSPENYFALALCDRCPVLARCAASAVSTRGGRPRNMIQAARYWRGNGRPVRPRQPRSAATPHETTPRREQAPLMGRRLRAARDRKEACAR